MPYNLKSRRVRKFNTSDSDSDLPFYKREQLRNVKKIKTNLQTLCDADSPTQSDSDTNFGFVRRSNFRSMNITNKGNDKHKKSHNILETKATSYSSESDASNSAELNKNSRKRATSRSVFNFDLDDSSYNSSASLKQSQRDFMSSSAQKQANKSSTLGAVSCSQVIESESNEKDFEIQNRRKMSKPSSAKKLSNEIDTIEIIEDECDENHGNDTGIIATTPITSNKVRTKKQDTPTNYKPYIMKIMEESKNRFTKFRLQITNLQQKYLKDDVVNLKDANDIIFMLTCIISKLKEELTEHQHDLMDSHIDWRMQHSPKCIVSSMQHERFPNNNHLQVQRKRHYPFNSDDLMCTPNTYRKRPLQVTKTSTNNIQLPAKHLESYKNHKQKDTESTWKENNFVQTGEENVVLQNNQSTLPTFDEVSKINNMNDSTKSSTDNLSNKKKQSRSSKCRWSNLPPIRRNFFKNILDIQKLLAESDADSTSSELNLYFPDVDKPENNQIDATDATDKSQNHVSENTLNMINNNTRPTSNRSFNSEETVILPKRSTTTNETRSSIIEEKMFSTRLNNKNLIREPDSQIVVPNTNNLRNKYRSKYTDKKLQMNCQVLIPRFRE